MTDGGKDWVTIRIPRDTRDDASDDPHTYEEIMQAGLEALEAKENIEDLGPFDGDVPEMDIGSVLEADKNDVEEILERLESVEAAAKEATNAAQTTQATVEDLTSQ